MADPIPSSGPRFSISVPTLSFGLALAVQAVLMLLFLGGLFQRVSAIEHDIGPVKAGRVEVLEERTVQIQKDVTWIRDRLERGAKK